VTEHRPATRLKTLEGLRVGILDNSKTNADKFLVMVFEELKHSFNVKEAKMIRKRELSQPALPDQIRELAESSDFVITGTGD
jgi:hypothetical protein